MTHAAPRVADPTPRTHALAHLPMPRRPQNLPKWLSVFATIQRPGLFDIYPGRFGM